MIEQILNWLRSWLPQDTNQMLWMISLAMIIVIATLLTLLLLIRIWRIRWKPPQVHTIRLKNQGNVNGIFQLSALAPANDLKFDFWAQGARLQLLAPPSTSPVSAPPAPAQTPTPAAPALKSQPGQAAFPAYTAPQGDSSQLTSPTPMPGTQPAQASAPPPQQIAPANGAQPSGAKENAAKAAKQAKAKGQKAIGLGRMLGGIMGTLGSLIPGSAGQSLKESANAMQSQTQMASSALQQPEMKLKSVEHLKGQTGALKTGVTGKKEAMQPAAVPASAASATPQLAVSEQPPVHPASAPGQITSTSSPAPAAPQQPANSAAALAANQQQQWTSKYIQTPILSPGEELALELRIEPHNPYRSAEATYWLFSRQQLHPDLPPLGSPPPALQIKKGVHYFHLKGVSQFFRLVKFLLAIIAIQINFIWAWLAIRWLTSWFQGA